MLLIKRERRRGAGKLQQTRGSIVREQKQVLILLKDCLFLRMHRGADVTAGLLFDGRGDDGRMGNAGLVEAVRRWSHHVRGETAGHQAERAEEGNILTVGFNSETSVNLTRKGCANLAHKCPALACG